MEIAENLSPRLWECLTGDNDVRIPFYDLRKEALNGENGNGSGKNEIDSFGQLHLVRKFFSLKRDKRLRRDDGLQLLIGAGCHQMDH